MPRAIAAALTPLRDGGAALDLDALDPYLAFLAGHGIDGVLLARDDGRGDEPHTRRAAGERSSAQSAGRCL